MTRVETVIPAQAFSPQPAELIMLRPAQILLDPQTAKARPGPPPPDEKSRIEDLAKSLWEIGQIVPLVVQRRNTSYYLVDGRRRLEAALTLDRDDRPFPLQCVLADSVPGDYLRAAIHANLKRRGLTHLQFAHLCQNLRKENGWTGTAEVADYIGVSRAQVSQHDKLLHKPSGMAKKTYDDLLEGVNSSRLSADAAFYILTHVKAEKAEAVSDRAQAIAGREAASKVAKAAKTAPAAPNKREKASQKPPEPPKDQSAKYKREWMAAQRKLSQEHRAKEKIEKQRQKLAEQKQKLAAKIAAAAAKVEKKHIAQAAKELHAATKDLQRSIPDLRRMFDSLRVSGFPDIMRNFISVLADSWWRGDANDKEVLQHWTQIAMLVEQQIEKTKTGIEKKKR